MIEILLLVIALSIDAFVASLAYGADRIKIPVRSAMALSIVSAFILLISMAGGLCDHRFMFWTFIFIRY